MDQPLPIWAMNRGRPSHPTAQLQDILEDMLLVLVEFFSSSFEASVKYQKALISS
jgi:hypothetical protein